MEMNVDFTNKTVLVTGATGLICSHLVPFLLEHGAHVIAIGRSIDKLKKTFAACNERLTLVEWNVTEPFSFLHEHVDYIFHAAGIISGKAIKEHPVSVIRTNLMGLVHCADILRQQKAKDHQAGKLIVFSSVTVYGNTSTDDITITEQDTAQSVPLDTPNSSYVESKRMSEVMAQAWWQEEGLPCIIVRFSYVYGPTINVPKTAFYEFVQDILANKDITMHNSSLPRRDNIYVDDAVNGLVTAALNGTNGEAYNISSNGELDNFAAIDEMAQSLVEIQNQTHAAKVALYYKNGSSRKRMPGICVNNDKLKQLGWQVQIGLRSGCQRTLNFYRGQ